MRALMYHYVRPSVDRPPFGYYHLSLEDFRRQLDYLEAETGFVDRNRFVAWARGERSLDQDGVVLTFDDGLVDHHEWVLPELESRDLWGVFFVPTGPLDDEERLAVHRIHSLLGRHDADALLEALVAILDEQCITADDDADGAYADRSSTDAVSSFKQTLNFEVPYDALGGVLDRLETEFTPAGSADAYYMSDAQLCDLRDAGMVLGAHSVTHRVLSRLPPASQRAEVVDSFARLETAVGPLETSVFAYPYGTAPTFDADTLGVLSDAGCDAAFTTISGDVRADDAEARPLQLRRRDCNEFPHGDATFDLGR